MDFKEKPSISSSSSFPLATRSSPELVFSSSIPQAKTAAMQKRKAGRKKFQETRHPIYKGVRQRNGKWVCELRQPQKKSRVWMGTFPCPEMAARAYDVAAFALKGDSASLNFPEAASSLEQASVKDTNCDVKEACEEFSSHVKHSSSCPASLLSMVGLETDLEASKKVYVDEEELFNMPGLLDSMAEGLMLTPPTMANGFDWDDFDDSLDLTLWSSD